MRRVRPHIPAAHTRRLTPYALRITFYAVRFTPLTLVPRAARPGVALVRIEGLVEPAAPAAFPPALALGVHIHSPGSAHDVERFGRAIVAGLHGHKHATALDALGIEVGVLLGDAQADQGTDQAAGRRADSGAGRCCAKGR